MGMVQRKLLRLMAVALAVLALATPGFAQSTGMVKGKVVDGQGEPVENAKIIIEFQEGVNRRNETKTNKKGEFIQIGLIPGNYKVTAEKEKLGSQSFDVRVRLGAAAEVNFALIPGQAGQTKEEAAKSAALKKAFEEGVALSRAGSHDEAIAKFTEAATLVPNCSECYYNIGHAYLQKKEYEKAEAAYKKAIEIRPEYAEAYNGLAITYNAARKFDLATAASAKAAELGGAAAGGNADALYNQGVISWNAGNIPEAKKQFEQALKVNPNHADAHFQLGMALLNEGKMTEAVAELETNLKLAPDGPHADQAKALLSQIKK